MLRGSGGNLFIMVIQGLPLWVAWILGGMLCFLEWKKSPRASAMALGAIGLMAANWLASRLFYGVILPRAGSGFFGYGGAGFAMASFLFSAVEAAAVGLLIVAVFQERKAATGSTGQVS